MVNVLYFSKEADAWAEANRRRVSETSEHMVTKVAQSPYGGYMVYSVPADLYLDGLMAVGSGALRPDLISRRKAM
jgi:hypothetical protein